MAQPETAAVSGRSGRAQEFQSRRQGLSCQPVHPEYRDPDPGGHDEPATGGSLRGDKAFSHFFGLNNLINSSEPTSYSTGLSASDAHGFAVGSKFKMRLSDVSGQIIADREITIPAGTMGDIVNALNDPTTGFGIYGNYALDSAGKLKWTPTASSEGFTMNMTQDVAPRGNTSLSLGQITGLNQDKRFGRANALTINSNINANPRLLALADPDLSTATVGSVAVGLADSKGAQKRPDIRAGGRNAASARRDQ